MNNVPQSDLLSEASVWYARISQGRLAEKDGLAFDEWLSHPAHLEAFTAISECWDELNAHRDASLTVSLRSAPSVPELRQAETTTQAAEYDELEPEALEPQTSWKQPKSGRRWFIAGGAITALAASIALLLMPPAGPALGPLDLQSDRGHRASTTLADGSVVTLDGGSQVLVESSRKERSFQLASGRALFQVQSDERPFVVEAGSVTVTATGTRFSVERLPNQVLVELYEGGIIVRASPNQLEQVVKPVSRLIIYDDARAPILLSLKDNRGEAWATDDKVVLVDETLDVAADRMARMSAHSIEVDPSVASLKVSGVFAAGEIEGFVDAVTTLLNVQAESRERGVRFVPRKAGGVAHPET